MIPLSVPNLNGNEWEYVKECLDTGWISSSGSYVNRFEKSIAEFVGAKFAIACMNGTVGLQISQLVCGVNADDYVIAPNLTFVATINSIKYLGASPILIDCTCDSWQMDLDLLEYFLQNETELKKISGSWHSYRKTDGRRISTVIPVHVLGNIGEISRLIEICKKYHLVMIEDSAEALGSFYNSKHAGRFGKVGVFSFNGNKIISTGGGGMIVTDDENLAKYAKHITTTAKVKPEEYIHDEVGYNYRMVNVLAAIGVAQMEQLEEILQMKKRIDSMYRNGLKDIGDITFQHIDKKVNANSWMTTIRTSHMRDLLNYLNKYNIECRPFWMPMNQLNMFKNELFISEGNESHKIYKSCISIPCSSGLTLNEQQDVIENIRNYFESN